MSQKGDAGIADAALAFGPTPTLAARGAYLKQYGAAAFEEERIKWRASAYNLKPGTRPELYGEQTKSKNPWADPINKAEIVRLLSTLSTATCSQMAKSQGKQISGAPLRR